MALVTVAQYRARTGDTSSESADITTALDEAQALVEEVLDRPLELAERTEVMTIINGRVYPKATPITASPYSVDGHSLYNINSDMTVEAFDPVTPRATVTYTGGYTTDTLPIRLRYGICSVAHRLLNPPVLDSSIPIGASSVRVGDVSVTYGAGGAGVLDSGNASITPDVRRLIRGYRWEMP